MVKLPNQVKNMVEDYLKKFGYDFKEDEKKGFDFIINTPQKGNSPPLTIQKKTGKDKIHISTGYSFTDETSIKGAKTPELQYLIKKDLLLFGLDYAFKSVSKEIYTIIIYETIRVDDLDEKSFLVAEKKVRLGQKLIQLEFSRLKVVPSKEVPKPEAGEAGIG